ncbi:DUF998 domain-containing protein [Candidatus Bathyarchaeota archaeon]|nr:DUF998 domain-containing protein [Candidatus Bathyarchaeota archaeon]
MERNMWFKISGICGIITPIITLTLISLAIGSYPPFSWTENALSDLGVQEGITAILFNSSLIIGGILTLIFALGLFLYLHNMLGKIGAFTFILDAFALSTIGVFPENIKSVHFYASVAFFVLFPLAMFFVTASFLQMREAKMGLFTFLIALFATIVWAIQWTIQFGPNVAIPEALSAFSAATWSIVLGYKMLRHSSH